MAELTEAERDRLPASDFIFPERRAYPYQDEAHARAALARVAEYGTPAEEATVHRKIHERYPDMKIEED